MSQKDLDFSAHQLPSVIHANERIIRASLLTKARRVAGFIPFAEDLMASYYCAIDSKTPLRVRGVLLAALAYFVLPVDMIPDFIVGFGFTDDAAVIATALGIVSGHIKNRHRENARLFLFKPALPRNDAS